MPSNPFARALEVYTRQEFPRDWAMTQNNLGTALHDQALRSSGLEAVQLLADAVKAFRAALDVCTDSASLSPLSHTKFESRGGGSQDYPTAGPTLTGVPACFSPPTDFIMKGTLCCTIARDVAEPGQFVIGWALSQPITSSAFWSGGNT